MALPRILVFDDMAGWLPSYRERMCKRLLLRDITDGPNAASDHSFLADAVFHPAQIRADGRINNSIEAALSMVQQGVDHPPKNWALVLTDLQFDHGEVPDGDLDQNESRWPRNTDPKFGLSLLEALQQKWPDPQRPGRTMIPVAALSRSRELDVELALNNLGNLGYLCTTTDGNKEVNERRRLSDLLFHYGLFPDGPVRTVAENGKIQKHDRTRLMFGSSAPMLLALRAARQAAASGAPCLLQGDVGTGKGEFARLIHDLSDRDGQFRQRDCASLPEQLLETELFGYAKNAALENQNKLGKAGDFELANKGTLFLDELGAMTEVNQAKLLITLQEKRVQRLGAEDPVPVDVRIIGATHLDLKREVDDKRFNHALYSRLDAFVVRVPTLNERREDIPALFQMFVERETKAIGGEPSKEYPEDAMELLRARDWEFNVRQLENFAKRIATERKYSKVIAPNDVREYAKGS